MNRKSTLLFVGLALLLVGLALAALPALADGPASYGDAMALLQTWNNGGRVARQHAAAGALADPSGIAILPFRQLPEPPHYCVEDHHLIMVAWIAVGDAPYTRQDAAAELDGISQTFALDGQPLVAHRTPIKRRVVNTFGFDIGFAFNEGVVVPPEGMGVGLHTIDWTASYDDGTSDANTFTLIIDAAGTGACQ